MSSVCGIIWKKKRYVRQIRSTLACGSVDVEQRLSWSRFPGVSLPTRVSCCPVRAAGLVVAADCGELDIANDKEAMAEAIKRQLMKKCTVCCRSIWMRCVWIHGKSMSTRMDASIIRWVFFWKHCCGTPELRIDPPLIVKEEVGLVSTVITPTQNQLSSFIAKDWQTFLETNDPIEARKRALDSMSCASFESFEDGSTKFLFGPLETTRAFVVSWLCRCWTNKPFAIYGRWMCDSS